MNHNFHIYLRLRVTHSPVKMHCMDAVLPKSTILEVGECQTNSIVMSPG